MTARERERISIFFMQNRVDIRAVVRVRAWTANQRAHEGNEYQASQGNKKYFQNIRFFPQEQGCDTKRAVGKKEQPR